MKEEKRTKSKEQRPGKEVGRKREGEKMSMGKE